MRFDEFDFGIEVRRAVRLGMLMFLLLLFKQRALAQNAPLPTAERPHWVKVNPLPSMLFEEAEDSTATFVIYYEEQVNYLTNETYERTVCRMLAGENENKSFNFSKTYNPADDSVQLIGFKWTRAGGVRRQWDRSSDFVENYQINNGLFHSERKVQLYGNKAKDGDFFEVELLVSNMREDISHVPIPEYRFVKGTYNFIRVISPSRLNTVELQGMPAPGVDSTDSQFEYVWEGVGIENRTENNPSWRYTSTRLSASPFETNKELLQWKMPLYQLDESSKIAVSRKQRALTQGAKDLEAKIIAILNYVQDSITYQEYGLYAPRMPDRTIADGYGDCKSKSLLGVELLREAGVPSWPTMVSMHGYEQQFEGFTSPQKFNHCVIQYVYNNDTFTIDATTPRQGDRLGKQYYEPFRKGLRLQEEEVDEVFIRPAEASNLNVFDVYRATDHSVTRKVIAEGQEADRLRKVYEYHGLKGLHKIVKYRSEAETGYVHTLDLGYNYRSRWKREGQVAFRDWNSKDANKVEIVIFYAIDEGFSKHFSDFFDLDHFRSLIKEYPIAEEIEEVGFREPISITHKLTMASDEIQEIYGDSLTDTIVSLRLGNDVLVYHNRTTVHEDSVVLEQSFHIPMSLSLNEAREFNALMEEIKSERTRMRELPALFASLLPDGGFQDNWWAQMAGVIGSLLVLLVSLAFFILGVVHLVKGKRRKRRFKELKVLRGTLMMTILAILCFGTSHAQTTKLVETPTWVDSYAPDSSLKGNEQIQIVQQEVQVNDLTKEVFYRNTYEVNRKGPSHTCFLSITYDAEVERVELTAFHVDRDGETVSMLAGLIQRNEQRITSANGLVLKNRVTLYFHNDLFKNRDLVTVAYIKKPKEGCASPLSEYSFEAGRKRLACRYIFSVISGPGELSERHFQGFEKPIVLTTQDGQKWLWDQVFGLKMPSIVYTEPKTPSWYNEKPHVYVFSSRTQESLAQEVMKLPRFVFQDEALELLFENSGIQEGSLYEKVSLLDRYLRDSFIEYEIALVNERLSYTDLVKTRSADALTKGVLFSKALLTLGVENELFLVRKGGIDSSHAQVLSTELFSHAIVRYQMEGHTCYFDPGFEGLGKHLGHYRKFHYRYGLNLTFPGSEKELFTIPRIIRNQLVIRDTIQHSGLLERWMFFQGDLASDLRDGYYTDVYSFKKQVIEGWGMTNVFPSDIIRLEIPVNQGDVDSFVYSDTESGGVSLYLSFHINAGDSIDPGNASDHFRTVGLCDELKTLYSDEDLDGCSIVKRADIEIQHTVTVPDQLLFELDIPDISLEASTAKLERSTSYSEGLFTLDFRYSSTTDFMTKDLYDKQFYLDLAYHVIPYNTLDSDGLLGYQKSLKRETGKWLEMVFSIIGLVVMLCAASIALFGLYKTVLGFRKRRKRKARLKHLMAHN